MLGLSSAQIKAALERLVYIAIPAAVTYQYIPADDAPLYTTLALACVGTFIGIYQNRQKRLADRAVAANPGSVMIVDPATAAASKSADVVSSAEYAVTPK